MILYSNSCSFGAPDLEHDVYSDYVAGEFSAELLNKGLPKSCNRRIIRRSLRDLIELVDTSDVFVLIGLTFISRTELWQPWIDPAGNDGHFLPVQIDQSKIDWSVSGLIDTVVPDIHKLADVRIQEYYKNWLLHYHPESIMTDLLTDIIMFTGWLERKNIKYLVFSNAELFPGDNKVGYNSPFIESLKQQILNNKNIINPWEFSFCTHSLELGLVPKDYHVYKNQGHPGGEAHKKFADLLITHLKQKL